MTIRLTLCERDAKMHKIWSVDFQENCCHQMSDFMAKMDHVVCQLGLCSRPHWGAYSAPPFVFTLTFEWSDLDLFRVFGS